MVPRFPSLFMTDGILGHRAWIKKLSKKFKPFHVRLCMEATGIYYLQAAKFFHEKKGFAVIVANPAQVKSFAGAELIRTKTDPVDAGLIARFAMAMSDRLPEWTPPSASEEEILRIVRHMDALKKMRQAEENRLHALDASGVDAPDVRMSVSEMISFIDGQVKALEKRLRDIAGGDPDIGEDIRLLRSIGGVGETTAFKLFAELGDVNRFENGKQVVAYAGLAPCERTSGSSVRGKPRINKHGSEELRTPLYFPAITATKCNPVIKEFYERLLLAGKVKMVAVVACMKKLLLLAYGVLKNKEMFDANHRKQILA